MEDIFWIYLEAPFACFRPITVGKYRQMHTVISPTAALNIIKNILGLEINDEFECTFCVGLENKLERSVLLTHYHTYAQAYEIQSKKGITWPQKPNIQCVLREIGSNFKAYLGIKTDNNLKNKLKSGLNGEIKRHGIPFAGDNNMIFSKMEECKIPNKELYWLKQINMNGDWKEKRESFSMSTKINRKEFEKTKHSMFKIEHSNEILENCWLHYTASGDLAQPGNILNEV
jgi:CRISPR-associated protein Cas5t